ncbi:hypothetical protein ACP70R_026224 [Stipagrostis hirtigluma subsp. patula]
MEDFRFYEEGNYFREFKFYEEESCYFLEFSTDYLVGEEAFFSTQHICAITCSECSLSPDELVDTMLEDFEIVWPRFEDAYRKSKEGERERALIELESDTAEKGVEMRGLPGRGSVGKKELTFELVSQHFSMPIKQAARELNVGLTFLKRKCRHLGIPRWPHRKVKSLQTLINNVQELSGEQDGTEEGALTRSLVEMLQQKKRMIEEKPEMTLDDKTKVFRQACFKETFKRRRLMCHGAW